MKCLLPFTLTASMFLSVGCSELEQKCTLTDDLEAILRVEDADCTDNDSTQVVVNLWDQSHRDPEYQDSLWATSHEITTKWEIPLFAIEGLQGYYEDFEAESWDHEYDKNYQQFRTEGVTVTGLEGEVYNYLEAYTEAGINHLNATLPISECYIEELKKGNLEAEKCLELQREIKDEIESTTQAMYSIASVIDEDVNILDESDSGILSHSFEAIDLRSRIVWHYRSYGAMETILQTMEDEGQDRILMKFGAGHQWQVQGYLDQEGISHIDLYIKDKFKDPMEMQFFSEIELDEYQRLALQGVFSQY
jgi:hypothetical protein